MKSRRIGIWVTRIAVHPLVSWQLLRKNTKQNPNWCCVNYLEQEGLGFRSSLFGPVQLPFALPVKQHTYTRFRTHDHFERSDEQSARRRRKRRRREDTVCSPDMSTVLPRTSYLCSNAANRRESRMFSSGSQVLYLRTRTRRLDWGGGRRRYTHTHAALSMCPKW